MPEPATDTEPKSPHKPKRPASAPPPPPDAGVTAWRTWAIAGAVLLGGVVAWKLLGSSYKGDVETVCNGEAASGLTLEKDTSKVTAYVRQHLGTPEGNTFYSTLTDTKLSDRAKRLEDEANKVGVRSCPAVASIQKIASTAEYRSDMQRLCSSAAFPHLGELDDGARLNKLEDWIDTQAKSPRTKEIGAALRQGSGADRAKLLRETAQTVDIFQCDVAKTLEGPILPSKGKGPPVVHVYAEPQIIGVFKAEDLKSGVALVTPAMNECYKTGLERKPDLDGKLTLKLRVDPNGKVTQVQPADTSVADQATADCIMQVVKGMDLPKNPGPLVSVLLPLELTTAGVALPASAPPPPGSAAPPASTSGGH
jgi:hypothetical protein